MSRVGASVVALVMACALGACTPDDPQPTVTPLQPSSTPTSVDSSATPSPTASSATPSQSATPDQAALVKEAEGVYRAYVPETLKLEAAGGAKKLPPVFDQYLMDPYRGVVEQTYTDLAVSGSKVEKTDQVEIRELMAIPHATEPGAIVGLSACLDASRAVVRKKDGSQQPGGRARRELFFKRDMDGKLKIFFGSAEVVSKC